MILCFLIDSINSKKNKNYFHYNNNREALCQIYLLTKNIFFNLSNNTIEYIPSIYLQN